VAGAEAGLGKDSALAMAKAGADVAVIDLKGDMGRQTVEETRALGRKSTHIHCDVSDPQEAAQMLQEVVDTRGGHTIR
jgi:NAD(P)-dependent dehydrogenase (short-subunit alcohol dehydrogenase family)